MVVFQREAGDRRGAALEGRANAATYTRIQANRAAHEVEQL